MSPERFPLSTTLSPTPGPKVLPDLVKLWSALHDYLTCQFAIGLSDAEAEKRLPSLYHELLQEHNRIHADYIARLEPAAESLASIAGAE